MGSEGDCLLRVLFDIVSLCVRMNIRTMGQSTHDATLHSLRSNGFHGDGLVEAHVALPRRCAARPKTVTRITEPSSSGGRHPAGSATVAFTDGHKMRLHHFGCGMNDMFGLLTVCHTDAAEL